MKSTILEQTEIVERDDSNPTPLSERADDEVLMSHVVCEDHELLYLHTCLAEILES